MSVSARKFSAATAVVLLATACSPPPPAARQAVSARPEAAPAADSPPQTVVGKAPVRAGQIPVILLEPLAPLGGRAPKPADHTPIMDQYLKTFAPEILFVRPGQSTEFRNSDGELHNVRVHESTTKHSEFNIALPIGSVYRHTFAADGLYRVQCDIHPDMSALIVAATAPYVAVADIKGNFVLDNVVPGSYTLKVIAGTERFEQIIDVGDHRTEVTIGIP